MTQIKNERSSARHGKRFEDLTIQDNFMFEALMQDTEICRVMLERILDIEIDRVEFAETEKSVNPFYSGRGIRLDVYARSPEIGVFNVEMQVERVKVDGASVLPKRSRYYHSTIDTAELKRGMEYTELPPAYVIFICAFDEFGLGLHRYTFRNRCDEDHDLLLGDGAVKVVLNTKGTADDVSPELKQFLDYVDGREYPESDEFLRKIDRRCSEIKQDEEWREQYMFISAEWLDMKREERREGRIEGHREGRIEGHREGLEKGKILGAIDFMRADGRDEVSIRRWIAENYGLSDDEADRYMTEERDAASSEFAESAGDKTTRIADDTPE